MPKDKTECPKCKFMGDEKFPNGFTVEPISEAHKKLGVKEFVHCPKCGYMEMIKN